MALRPRATLAYFDVRENKGEAFLVLSEVEDGPILWKWKLSRDTENPRPLSKNLAQWLDQERAANIDPILADNTLQAHDVYGLEWTLPEAIQVGIERAIGSTVTLDQMVNRVDRLQYQLDHLRHMLDTFRG